MKNIIFILLLAAGAANAQCVFVPNSIHCQERTPQRDYYAEQQRQRELEEMKRQIEQQRRLNEMNYHNSQQPRQFRQHCEMNVFGVIECK